MIKDNTVVIVGRVNVGKSTLFNKLSTRVKSITLDYEGVTRDYLTDIIEWQGYYFTIVDSGGIILKKTEDEIAKKVLKTIDLLLEDAQVVLFVTDAKVGLTSEDLEIAQYIRKFNVPVIVVPNKIDKKKALENISEFYGLGFEDVVPISAEHSLGINDLLDAIIKKLPKKVKLKDQKEPLSVAFLGKPNVGKSSLLNALLEKERAIVSAIPGTTREPIREHLKFYKESIEIIDTPGIRRKKAIKGEIEPLMVKKALDALKKVNIVVLIIDGSESEIVDQELKLAFYAFQDQYKAVILVINKEDLMTDLDKENLKYSFKIYPQLIKKIPIIWISCKTGKNIGRILPIINEVNKRYEQNFNSDELRRLFITSLDKRPLYKEGELLRVFDVKQLKSGPPIIELKVNEPKFFGPSQRMYFDNIMRSNYDLKGIPIKFIVKKGI